MMLMEKEMATHSSTRAWKSPWTEEPGGLQSMGSQKSGTTEHTHMGTWQALENYVAREQLCQIVGELALSSSVSSTGTEEPGSS